MSDIVMHHLNCGIIGGLKTQGRCLICHCLLLETKSSGLVLVDTGLGLQDFADPAKRLGPAFTYLFARPVRDPGLAAINRVTELGFSPKDVRHIVMTHLDLDHVGGLVDFPHAKVHTHAVELEAAMTRPKRLDRERYMLPMFAHRPDFVTYRESGERWFGFDAVKNLDGLPDDILMVPLTGHSRGQTGIAIRQGDGWLLHAGDSYFDYREVKQPKRECAPILEVFEFFNQDDKRQRVYNQDRLRQLAATHREVTMMSAHDPFEFPEPGAVADRS